MNTLPIFPEESTTIEPGDFKKITCFAQMKKTVEQPLTLAELFSLTPVRGLYIASINVTRINYVPSQIAFKMEVMVVNLQDFTATITKNKKICSLWWLINDAGLVPDSTIKPHNVTLPAQCRWYGDLIDVPGTGGSICHA